MLARCTDRDVLIVSHNKKLQQLIGDMFPNFARQQNEKGGCKFGIANCSVLEIYKDIGEKFEETETLPEVPNHPNFLKYSDPENYRSEIQERNEIIQQREEALEMSEKRRMIQDASSNYKLRVLFNGFPDKEECVVGVSKRGGAYTKKRGKKKGTKKNTKNTKKTKKYRGGASSYHYLKANDHNILGAFFSKQYNHAMEGDSLFEKMFKAGANKIILVRHGNGPHNKPYSDKTIVNPPLTALGVYQAYLAGQAINRLGVLDLGRLFSLTSQLKRAQQTALQFLVSAFQVEGSLPNTFIKNCSLCLSNVYNENTQKLLKSKSFYKLLDNMNSGVYDLAYFTKFVADYNLVNKTNYDQGIASFEAKRQKKRANAALEKTARAIANSVDTARAEAEQQKEIDRAKAEQQKLMKKYKPFECWRFLNGGKPVQVIINQVIPNQIIYQTWNIELEKYNEEETIMSLRDFNNLPGLKPLKMCPDIALQDVKSAAYRPLSPFVRTDDMLSSPKQSIGFSGRRKKEGRPAPVSTFPFSNKKSSLGFTERRRLGRLGRPATGGKQKTKKRIKKTKNEKKNGKKNGKKKLITKRKKNKGNKNKKRTRRC
jgi:phosphohistidine phosphatase SixA